MSARNKPVILILVVMTVAVGLVAILAWTQTSHKNNGFTRNFAPLSTTLLSASFKEEDIVDVCGVTHNEIYFRTKTPDKIWVADRNLQNGRYVNTGIPNNPKIASLFICFADSTQVSILAGNLPGILIAKTGQKYELHKIHPSLFTLGTRINDNTYVMRAFDKTVKKDQIFVKVNLRNQTSSLENGVSELRRDFGLSTDGILSYDQTSGIMTYVYYYKNTFLAIDTNLNLLYTSRTIDTTNNYKIEVGEVSQGQSKSYTNTKPKQIINVTSCISNGVLYNKSLVISDNEKESAGSKYSVIDMYNVKDGAYLKSFYIPGYKDEKLRYFKVIGNNLIGVYKSNIVNYKLSL